jgi:hypothetical protein
MDKSDESNDCSKRMEVGSGMVHTIVMPIKRSVFKQACEIAVDKVMRVGLKSCTSVGFSTLH